MCVCVGGGVVKISQREGTPRLELLPSSTGSPKPRRRKVGLLVLDDFHIVFWHHSVGCLTVIENWGHMVKPVFLMPYGCSHEKLKKTPMRRAFFVYWWRFKEHRVVEEVALDVGSPSLLNTPLSWWSCVTCRHSPCHSAWLLSPRKIGRVTQRHEWNPVHMLQAYSLPPLPMVPSIKVQNPQHDFRLARSLLPSPLCPVSSHTRVLSFLKHCFLLLLLLV